MTSSSFGDEAGRAARADTGIPGARADYAPTHEAGGKGAVIAAVAPGSPAERTGLRPGMIIELVDGEPMRDVIDWFWLADGFEVELDVVDENGDEYAAVLEREPGEQWGIEFTDNIFDGVKTCCNACTFCFMAMLPDGMRPSMSLRDDDYRLSFLQGNFVTLTNLDDEDVERIIEQELTPLHFSLHAVGERARRSLMGRNHARGLEVAERLQEAGIELHVQIVLVPGENDGEELDETLRWAIAREGVASVGIVPLGFTRFQGRFARSFDERGDALAVIEQVHVHQDAARELRGTPLIQLADEFYVNAFPEDTEDHLPPASDYDGYPQFFDGIGMLRTLVDDWSEELSRQKPPAHEPELPAVTLSEAKDLTQPGSNPHAAIVCGRALEGVLGRLLRSSGAQRIDVLGVDNEFFGGNVDVTGLLTGRDVARALASWKEKRPAGPSAQALAILPVSMFNDDGLTLDDMTAFEVGQAAGLPVRVVCYSANEIIAAAREIGCMR